MRPRHDAADSADRQAGPDRAHPSRRHGDRPLRLAGRPEGPRGHRVPGGGERLHRGVTAGLGGAAIVDLRRDQGAHPGDRPVGAGAQGELVAVRAHRGGPAVRDPLPPPGPRRRGHPADAGGRQAPRRRGGAARRERARRGRVLLARRAVGQPGRAAARLLHRLLRRRAVHAAGQGPGDRLGARRRGPRHLLRLRLVARRLDPVLRHRRRGVAAVPGLAARGRYPRRRRRGGVRGGRREVLARRRAPAATSASSRSRPRPS